MSYVASWKNGRWNRDGSSAGGTSERSSLIGSASARIGGDIVDQMLRTPGATWAHRGGSANWPEMTKYAYDQSLAAGYRVLEISFSRTSDGVWFGLHDETLDRVAQVTGDVLGSSMTWAQLRANYQVRVGASGAPRPFMSWAELIDGLPADTILVVDLKHQITQGTARWDEFIEMVKRDWGVHRSIFKFSGVGGGSVALANRARDAGFIHRWGYFYESEYLNGTMERDQGAWSILGMEWSASQTAWNACKSYGKPVVGHIVPNLAAYNTAMTKGADVVQCADVAGIPAIAGW